jgi:hypothetical protein
MKYIFLFFSVTILFSSCISKKHLVSKIYAFDGKLLAYDTFCIKTSQVKKFSDIEDEFMDSLLFRFKFPAIYRENGIQLYLIIEFVLDKHGNALDVQIVDAHAEYSGFNEEKFKKDFQQFYSKQLKEALFNMQCSNEFKGKNEHFYIPVKYSFGTKSERRVENGWLHVIEQPIHLIEKGIEY